MLKKLIDAIRLSGKLDRIDKEIENSGKARREQRMAAEDLAGDSTKLGETSRLMAIPLSQTTETMREISEPIGARASVRR